MHIHTFPNIDFSNKHTVLTVGTFDGVHKGHVSLLSTIATKAKEENLESVLITFINHPRFVLHKDPDKLRLLNTKDEKEVQLKQSGIDHLVYVEFTPEFSNLSPEDYIQNFLIKQFKPKMIIIGYDHKFGKNRTGNFHLLQKLCSEQQIQVEDIPANLESDNAISSTRIRNAIADGKIEEANHLLGYSYPLSGIVVQGKQLGNTLGYPTANIQLHDSRKLIPEKGVYAAQVFVLGKAWKGMLYIGDRPTFQGFGYSIEVYIYDFEASIYNHSISISIEKRIRGDIKFNSKEELISQIQQDDNETKSFFQL